MNGKIILLFFLWQSQLFAAEMLPQRFSRNINIAGHEPQALLAVPLDEQVYAGSAVDFSDLRLVDQNGVETPYLLQKIGGSKTVVNRIPVQSKKTLLQKSGAEGFEVIVTIDKDAAEVDGLTVVTEQRDFEYALQIQGSDNGKQWRTLVDKALIFDYSRFMSFGNRDIDLPTNHARHFKIIVAQAIQEQASGLTELSRTLQDSRELERKETIDIHKEPLHIQRIKLWRKETETRAGLVYLYDYPLTDFKISRDKEHQTTLIDVNAHLLPLNGIKLAVATANFSRSAEVQVPQQQGIKTRMHTVVQGTIEALHFGNFKRERVKLEFPELRRELYRVVIHDRDNPPLQIEAVIGTGLKHQLLFLRQLDKQYRLLYGAENQDNPHYEVAPIRELLRRGYQSKQVSLGTEEIISEKKHGFDIAELLNSDWFLGLVMSIMVLVLGWSLYRVYRRIGENDGPQI